MLFTVKEDLDLCIEFKLTPAQLFFIKMLIPDRSVDVAQGKKNSYIMAIKYQQELGGLSPNELADLISREIIVDYNDVGKTFHDYYEINSKFQHRFYLKVIPMPQELHDAYPSFFYDSSGKKYVAKGVSPAELSLDYLRAIKNDPEEHQKVLEDIEWAKKNKAIVLGLKKFVAAKYWLAIRELRTKIGTTKTSTNVTIL